MLLGQRKPVRAHRKCSILSVVERLLGVYLNDLGDDGRKFLQYTHSRKQGEHLRPAADLNDCLKCPLVIQCIAVDSHRQRTRTSAQATLTAARAVTGAQIF